MGDHPRSRGVYPGRSSTLPSASGSSPLARGLPFKNLKNGESVGIIPARAGFTLNHGRSLRRRGDHPRSRGVYAHETVDIFLFQGSSPLARGLLFRSRNEEFIVRIIPARAGFTE